MTARTSWTDAVLAATTAALLAVPLAVEPAQGQTPSQRDRWDGRNLSVEGRLGVTFPVGDLADAGGESGLAFTADALYNFHPNWSVYAGWGFHDFNCDGCPDDLASNGPHLGAKYIVDMRGDALPWARAGLLLGEASAFQDGTDVTSDRTVGLELATGIDYRIGDRISLTPTLWFNYYSAELPVQDLDMSYFLLDLGVHYHF